MSMKKQNGYQSNANLSKPPGPRTVHSPRARGKRASNRMADLTKDKEKEAKDEFDKESIPLSEKEAHMDKKDIFRTDSTLSSGDLETTIIPNAVPNEKESENVDTNGKALEQPVPDPSERVAREDTGHHCQNVDASTYGVEVQTDQTTTGQKQDESKNTISVKGSTVSINSRESKSETVKSSTVSISSKESKEDAIKVSTKSLNSKDFKSDSLNFKDDKSQSTKSNIVSIIDSNDTKSEQSTKDSSVSVVNSKNTNGEQSTEGTTVSVVNSKETKGNTVSVASSKDKDGEQSTKGISVSVVNSKETKGSTVSVASSKDKDGEQSIKGSSVVNSKETKGSTVSVASSKDKDGEQSTKGSSVSIVNSKETKGSTVSVASSKETKGSTVSVASSKETKGSTVSVASSKDKQGEQPTKSSSVSVVSLKDIKGESSRPSSLKTTSTKSEVSSVRSFRIDANKDTKSIGSKKGNGEPKVGKTKPVNEPKVTVTDDSICNGTTKHIQRDTSPNNVGQQDKVSLVVPGQVVEGTDAQIIKSEARKDSEASDKLRRESTKFSMGSRKSIDLRVQYTTVQMPTAEDKTKPSVYATDDSWIRIAIPYLPVGLAVFCLFMNICVPGSGTIISGFSIFCCAKSRVPPKYDQDVLLILCVNIWVGVAQLFTVSFLLVGWFWSLAWGIKMVILSVERRQELKDQRAKELQTLALKAFGSSMPAAHLNPLM